MPNAAAAENYKLEQAAGNPSITVNNARQLADNRSIDGVEDAALDHAFYI